MKYLKQTISASTLLALIVAFTFTASQAQNKVANNLKSNQKNNEMLLGKVINAQTGDAIANAQVTIMLGDSSSHGNNHAATVATNSRGLFIVTGVSKGDHAIQVNKAGYEPWKNTIYMQLLNKKHPGGPLNGFFRPNNDSHGWLHGVFHTNKNNNHPANMYVKSVFVTIGLQKKQ
jgi:hypothetical protein